MRKKIVLLLMFLLTVSLFAERILPLSVYRDKMKGGWAGQMIGVSIGGPTEFQWWSVKEPMPKKMIPKCTPKTINGAFRQDDLYVDVVFLKIMNQYGIHVPIRKIGIEFANTAFGLWGANYNGRSAMRRGIAPPDASHPMLNECANALDYQIEADFSGLVAPGMPQVVIELGNKFGRLMCYGDGVYAGIYQGAMYANAFFENDVMKIAEKSLEAIPPESEFAQAMREVIRLYHENPDDWISSWKKINRSWRSNGSHVIRDCAGRLDVRINGAYILLGLLYGNGDLYKTAEISTRCGLDSDCNPANAVGVLGTMLGFSKIPLSYTGGLDYKQKFLHTDLNFHEVCRITEKCARAFVKQNGGRIIKTADKGECFVIADKKPVPGTYTPSWEAHPIIPQKFTDAEYAQVQDHWRNLDFTNPEFKRIHEIQYGLDQATGFGVVLENEAVCKKCKDLGRKRRTIGILKKIWSLKICTDNRKEGLVFRFRPVVPEKGVYFSRFAFATEPGSDFRFVVKLDGKTVFDKVCKTENPAKPWIFCNIDLSAYAGKSPRGEAVIYPASGEHAAVYWGRGSILKKADSQK